MLTFIVIVYLIVAAIGIYLFAKLFTSESPKMVVGIIHGSLGLFGIACLIFYISFAKGDTPYWSVLLFVIALLFGGGMLTTTMVKKKFPKWIAVIHVLFALSGIYLLIKFWLN
ncbi:MAG TPA: hypothetical protein PKD83_01810 [Ignavibacteria bacterium]|nr:hypothetical protein [Ignavibacteria bacterium]